MVYFVFETRVEMTAIKSIAVYEKVNDDLHPIFGIAQGEKCLVGKTDYSKVDAFKKVYCKQGEGWVKDFEYLR